MKNSGLHVFPIVLPDLLVFALSYYPVFGAHRTARVAEFHLKALRFSKLLHQRDFTISLR